MTDNEVINRDQATGLFGFRLELGRDGHGTRMQARRSGFPTERAALVEFRRLCRQRDALHPRSRLSDTVQTICESWLLAREQEIEPNTLYNYGWLLGLLYPNLGKVRASRLSARMTERAYRDLEEAGISRTTLRTLALVFAKAFGEQTGRTLGARKPRESDDERPVWTLAEARRSRSTSGMTVSTRCGGCCWCPGCGAASCAACDAVTWNRTKEHSRCAGRSSSRNLAAGCE